MSQNYSHPDDLTWTCSKCHVHLVVRPATLTYMGNRITADLPQCPVCGFVLISEELALGKMAEVEQILEDK
ncbi:MAG: DVU_1557 family redox protein [Desulfatirhabdiaceae bacterium]